jgi:hypothetical protein
MWEGMWRPWWVKRRVVIGRRAEVGTDMGAGLGVRRRWV